MPMCLLVSHSSVADGFTIPPKAKTLLQILVEELPKHGGWPKGVKWLAQTPGGSILGREIYQSGPHFSLVLDTVADDYRTAKVMRDQYEAALAEKGIHTVKVECQVVDADGWIDWHGGECPVSGNTPVDVKFNSGACATDYGYSADSYTWKHGGLGSQGFDIIAYRLHQPQDANNRANDERLAGDAEQALREVASCGASGAVYQKLAYELDGCIGQAPENITEIRGHLLEVLSSTGLEVKLNNALKVVNAIIDAGYRKQ